MQKSLYIPLFCLLSYIAIGCGHNKSTERNNTACIDSVVQAERDAKARQLTILIKEGKFGDGMNLLDTLHREYPNDAQFYFIEGWLLDYLGNRQRAERSFEISLSKYDSLTTVRKDFRTSLNRAFLIYALRGDSAYQKELDTMSVTYVSDMDSATIDMFRKIRYDKNSIRDQLVE